jgi:hypothetical protein
MAATWKQRRYVEEGALRGNSGAYVEERRFSAAMSRANELGL